MTFHVMLLPGYFRSDMCFRVRLFVFQVRGIYTNVTRYAFVINNDEMANSMRICNAQFRLLGSPPFESSGYVPESMWCICKVEIIIHIKACGRFSQPPTNCIVL